MLTVLSPAFSIGQIWDSVFVEVSHASDRRIVAGLDRGARGRGVTLRERRSAQRDDSQEGICGRVLKSYTPGKNRRLTRKANHSCRQRITTWVAGCRNRSGGGIKASHRQSLGADVLACGSIGPIEDRRIFVCADGGNDVDLRACSRDLRVANNG